MRKIIKKLLAATITGSILLSGCGTESNGNISESKESTPAQETVQAEKQEEKAKGGNGKTIVKKNIFNGDRRKIRLRATRDLLNELRIQLEKL